MNDSFTGGGSQARNRQVVASPVPASIMALNRQVVASPFPASVMALNRQVAASPFPASIMALNRQVAASLFPASIMALNRQFAASLFPASIMALNRQFTASLFPASIMALNRQVAASPFPASIMALNRQVAASLFPASITALNRQVAASLFPASIMALNRQFAASLFPASIMALNRQFTASLFPASIMALNRHRAIGLEETLKARPASSMDFILPVAQTQMRSTVRSWSTSDSLEIEHFERRYETNISLDLYDQMITDEGLLRVSRKLFADGHYTRAVEESFKYLNNSVKSKSGLSNKDGADLMRAAFSTHDPALRINALQSRSDENEQKGYMDIYVGVMIGIRNPRVHEHELVDEPQIALELLVWANHLMRMLNDSTPSQA